MTQLQQVNFVLNIELCAVLRVCLWGYLFSYLGMYSLQYEDVNVELIKLFSLVSKSIIIIYEIVWPEPCFF